VLLALDVDGVLLDPQRGGRGPWQVAFSERFGVAACDQRRIYAVTERLLGPGGRVFCGVHFQNSFQKRDLRCAVVNGHELQRSGELLFTEEQVTDVARRELYPRVADHVQVSGMRHGACRAQQHGQEEFR